jgi:hypothetical protein
MATQPASFKWRQTEPVLILCAVRWYLRYSLSYRDVEELLTERGLEADHATVWRWVQRYGPELEQRMRRHLKQKIAPSTVPPPNPGEPIGRQLKVATLPIAALSCSSRPSRHRMAASTAGSNEFG